MHILHPSISMDDDKVEPVPPDTYTYGAIVGWRNLVSLPTPSVLTGRV
jgi:hypothetical protein